MLAVKFHHLRALIHRPYLCLPFLRHIDDSSASSLHTDALTIQRYEEICISEAQETAHLLHRIGHKKDLVIEFPFWQMISCLICASSVLLVASVFIRNSSTGQELDVTALNDDAETCMKVFEALSSHSDAARIARDMMIRLREQGRKWSKSLSTLSSGNQLLIKVLILLPSQMSLVIMPIYKNSRYVCFQRLKYRIVQTDLLSRLVEMRC